MPLLHDRVVQRRVIGTYHDVGLTIVASLVRAGEAIYERQLGAPHVR